MLPFHLREDKLPFTEIVYFHIDKRTTKSVLTYLAKHFPLEAVPIAP